MFAMKAFMAVIRVTVSFYKNPALFARKILFVFYKTL
jgi:hypothetical protein